MDNHKENEYRITPLALTQAGAAAEIARHGSDPWREGDVRAALADARRTCLGAFGPEGTLWGWCCFRVLAGDAELETLTVAPARRGGGIGRALVQAGLAAVGQQSAARCLLELRASNAAALGLYQRLGFRLLARRPGMYAAPPEDGLCMELDWSERNQ